MNSLCDIQKAIGYEFKDARLLESALTHSSYVNEHAATGNERIEFLGDCVLNFIVGERLFSDDRTASEGKLSSRRAALVSRAPLARIVDELGLLNVLKVGAGVNKSAFSVKARSDIFEAVLGAVYLDGGLDACRGVLDSVFFGAVMPERDYKSELQEYAAKHNLSVTYETRQADGGFESDVRVGDSMYSGRGSTKHGSQISAAKAAVSAFVEKR
ncbi:MAG: ribonuclease III [Clostridiales bacterium]|nr:ribonuclease III [Clostridiales bacterium]